MSGDIALLILCVLWLAANLIWSYVNWRTAGNHLSAHLAASAEIAGLKQKAQQVLHEAVNVAEKAAIEQEHKVCATCKRIVVKHSTDEEGVTTCVNCAADRVNGFANGVKIG